MQTFIDRSVRVRPNKYSRLRGVTQQYLCHPPNRMHVCKKAGGTLSRKLPVQLGLRTDGPVADRIPGIVSF